jgi:starvation-inducible DNA-binding protein
MTEQNSADNPVIIPLQELLASEKVFYQKAQSFHWYVTGESFFDLHDMFGDLYEMSGYNADQIAERVIGLGGMPINTMRGFLERSRIAEAPVVEKDQDIEPMVKHIIADLGDLNILSKHAARKAEKNGDRATVNKLDDMIEDREDKRWMLKSFIKD